jgi:hypothetical protein
VTNSTIKTLISLGSAAAATQTARALSSFDGSSLLGRVGLARQRSYFWENLALVGVGAVVGATGALLFAPASGSETRRRISNQATRLRDEAGQRLEEAKDNLLEEAKARMPGNAGTHTESRARGLAG